MSEFFTIHNFEGLNGLGLSSRSVQALVNKGVPAGAEFLMYGDGACSGNGAKRATPGGWGVALIGRDRHQLGRGGSPDTTNNQMELQAVIHGLRQVPRLASVIVRTDSQYVVKGCTEWRKSWERNGMKNSKKEPVLNEQLWKALWAEVDVRKVKFEWVRGHNGDLGNEIADALAVSGSKMF